jgi:hypothetical protein
MLATQYHARPPGRVSSTALARRVGAGRWRWWHFEFGPMCHRTFHVGGFASASCALDPLRPTPAGASSPSSLAVPGLCIYHGK